MAHATSPPPPPFFTLTYHRDVKWATGCLRAARTYLRDAFEFFLMEDGTLTADDKARLREELEGVRFLEREELDDRVSPALRGKPHCQAYRARFGQALKLIDVGLLAGGPFAQCDSDILFIRPTEGMDRRGLDEGIVSMQDTNSAYSVSYRNRHFGGGRIRLPLSFNSGFMFVGKGAFDLDFIEWFLGHDIYQATAWVIEQTAWAALAGRHGARYFAPDQVAFPLFNRPYNPARCAVLHFAGRARVRLDDPDFLEQMRRDALPYQESVTRLETIPVTNAGPWRDLYGRISRRLTSRNEL
ncbi:hypothetical protein [Aquisphaera insulae]|uniref:hypothetical protein n=1 Tax=Aquisphaera insulae TaxID=2712864 RepID=UPI0013EDD29B|nr:hypothetical protein [Aquisphaera insulae]